MNKGPKYTKIHYGKFFLFSLMILFYTMHVEAQEDEYWNMGLGERAAEFGLGYEEHQVTTEDGYILTLMRVLPGPESSQVGGNQPILLSAPFGQAGESFATLDSIDSPAFYLPNEGMDTWLFNMRGSSLSREHETLDSHTDDEYWDFYLDSIRYDYMACVQFILDTTGFSTMPVFAMSFGAATFTTSLALEPEFFSSRISIAILAVPALNLGHTNTLLYAFLGDYPFVLESLRRAGINVLREDNPVISDILYRVSSFLEPLTFEIGGVFMGENAPSLLDPDGASFLAAKAQNGVGNRVMQHLFQSTRSNDLTYFDYGTEENLVVYGTETPPEIPLENINIPIALMFAEEDSTITEPDQQWAREKLADNVVFDHVYEGYSHIAFLGGVRTEDFLDDILEITEMYPATTANER
ncbi:unnamed protein product [Moneuplotes crassus]|uniref:Partial AB-hydrolase lipase domain-containing protein n=1 Tax=Euplotes crassus TaxID=5936 RepID=A0AAD1UQC1_EUPCR|nr:unnamed protein product [Moneuplotes crassus]